MHHLALKFDGWHQGIASDLPPFGTLAFGGLSVAMNQRASVAVYAAAEGMVPAWWKLEVRRGDLIPTMTRVVDERVPVSVV